MKIGAPQMTSGNGGWQATELNRQTMDAIFYVLRTGCQLKGLDWEWQADESAGSHIAVVPCSPREAFSVN